ncbi:hemerythrin domain-containing protein [Micromonospora sp. NBC_01813]|uniref:hemerythrin domain-containing protein n=1 Tax=Micromonospora sp. NBC_01813 TaxID=2975988 RepID=UPI002DD8B21D|nr:hemerythrin domain-containing protein [Micromonospora sp. NBC_01813]WSA07160.1 hemerythrin domain-containing protein [Micromonospora sp. NBC_01813]
MAETDSPARPYTHEMVIIHRIFRRESQLLPRLVRAVPEGELTRADEVAGLVEEYLGGLHNHHSTEDEMIWPLLLARVDLEADLVRRMAAQHDEIDQGLGAIRDLLPQWRRTAQVGPRDRLAELLDESRTALLRHLDDEERQVLDLIAEHLTVAEWDAVGQRGMAEVEPSKRLLALGAILEDATPAERRYFLGKVPVVARLLWALVGKRQYARRADRVRSMLGD